MYLPRKSLVPLALVVGVFGTPRLSPARAPGAPGGVAHPLVVQLATAEPESRRRQRRVRGGKVRGILSDRVARLRKAAGRARPARQRIRWRRLHYEQPARGPPPAPAL